MDRAPGVWYRILSADPCRERLEIQVGDCGGNCESEVVILQGEPVFGCLQTQASVKAQYKPEQSVFLFQYCQYFSNIVFKTCLSMQASKNSEYSLRSVQ